MKNENENSFKCFLKRGIAILLSLCFVMGCLFGITSCDDHEYYDEYPAREDFSHYIYSDYLTENNNFGKIDLSEENCIGLTSKRRPFSKPDKYYAIEGVSEGHLVWLQFPTGLIGSPQESGVYYNPDKIEEIADLFADVYTVSDFTLKISSNKTVYHGYILEESVWAERSEILRNMAWGSVEKQIYRNQIEQGVLPLRQEEIQQMAREFFMSKNKVVEDLDTPEKEAFVSSHVKYNEKDFAIKLFSTKPFEEYRGSLYLGEYDGKWCWCRRTTDGLVDMLVYCPLTEKQVEYIETLLAYLSLQIDEGTLENDSDLRRFYDSTVPKEPPKPSQPAPSPDTSQTEPLKTTSEPSPERSPMES